MTDKTYKIIEQLAEKLNVQPWLRARLSSGVETRIKNFPARRWGLQTKTNKGTGPHP